MGWVGWDLCAGLFYEHRFAMLKNNFCTCICTWKQWRLQKVNSKNSSTWAAMPLWWLLMCEPMPELVHSLGLHPSLPRRTILSQCRHFASRKSSDSESKLNKINLICKTFILPKVCPPWTRSFPSCRHWLKLWLFDPLCKNHKAIICILVKKLSKAAVTTAGVSLAAPPSWSFGLDLWGKLCIVAKWQFLDSDCLVWTL